MSFRRLIDQARAGRQCVDARSHRDDLGLFVNHPLVLYTQVPPSNLRACVPAPRTAEARKARHNSPAQPRSRKEPLALPCLRGQRCARGTSQRYRVNDDIETTSSFKGCVRKSACLLFELHIRGIATKVEEPPMSDQLEINSSHPSG